MATDVYVKVSCAMGFCMTLLKITPSALARLTMADLKIIFSRVHLQNIFYKRAKIGQNSSFCQYQGGLFALWRGKSMFTFQSIVDI
jgi:hypothetical protein